MILATEREDFEERISRLLISAIVRSRFAMACPLWVLNMSRTGLVFAVGRGKRR